MKRMFRNLVGIRYIYLAVVMVLFVCQHVPDVDGVDKFIMIFTSLCVFVEGYVESAKRNET